jgi:hypothetical protein
MLATTTDCVDNVVPILARIVSHIMCVETEEDDDDACLQPSFLQMSASTRRLSFGVATSPSTVSRSIVRNRTGSASTPGVQSLLRFWAIVVSVGRVGRMDAAAGFDVRRRFAEEELREADGVRRRFAEEELREADGVRPPPPPRFLACLRRVCLRRTEY